MIQLTLVQIDNYGPWTVTPEPKREADLQTLQANIYAEIQELFSVKKALLHPMRYDNMIAVTNGLTEEDHKQIMNSINSRYPVTISMSVASAETAKEAQEKATQQLAEEGSAHHESRKSVLKTDSYSTNKVEMAHVDINGITKHTDTDVYHSYMHVLDVHSLLAKKLVDKGALVFFMGGDNFICPCNGLTKEDFLETFDEIEKEIGIELKAGIGIAKNSEKATHLASMGLKEIRAGSNEKVILKK